MTTDQQEESETAIYRIVCERCGMETSRMRKEKAEKYRDVHAESTGHETEVVPDA